MFVDLDYSSMSIWETADKPPVLVSCSQDYRILADLVATALRVLDPMHVFVGYWKRSLPQMPEILMDTRVFLANYPDLEVKKLIAAGRSEILVIKDNFGVTGRELYDNSIQFELYTRKHGKDDLTGFVDASILSGLLTELGRNQRPERNTPLRGRLPIEEIAYEHHLY